MRTVIQRVSKAGVTINGTVKAAIEAGLLIFVGIEDEDDLHDIEWLSNKIVNLRIFNDENNVPNISVNPDDTCPCSTCASSSPRPSSSPLARSG